MGSIVDRRPNIYLLQRDMNKNSVGSIMYYDSKKDIHILVFTLLFSCNKISAIKLANAIISLRLLKKSDINIIWGNDFYLSVRCRRKSDQIISFL